jgi:hypothetical protein
MKDSKCLSRIGKKQTQQPTDLAMPRSAFFAFYLRLRETPNREADGLAHNRPVDSREGQKQKRPLMNQRPLVR